MMAYLLSSFGVLLIFCSLILLTPGFRTQESDSDTRPLADSLSQKL
jgi:hypothetical protein